MGSLNPAYSSTDGVLFNKSQTQLIQCPEGKSGDFRIPDSVTNIAYAAFTRCRALTGIVLPDRLTAIDPHMFRDLTSLGRVTIGSGVTAIGDSAFINSANLREVYFKGNAPALGSFAFIGTPAVMYYRPGTTGWGATYGGRPAIPWNPFIRTDDGDFGIQTNGFGFNIAESASGLVLVQGCTNLTDASWLPVQTNRMSGNSVYFSDPRWTNDRARYYRLSMP